PCVVSPLTADELAILGADELPSYAPWYRERRISRAREREILDELVLTRMRARSPRSMLTEELVLHAASSLSGGTGTPTPDYPLEHVARAPRRPSTFQARYLILHEWPEPHDCAVPHRGYWGRPWPGH